MEGDNGASKFRSVAAKGNYLGQNMMDMQYAAKEISRFTSKPEEQDWRAAKRLARYLKDHKRIVQSTSTRSCRRRFSGCGRTRKSTSEGVAMLVSHCIKTHSQTQDAIALSSGESEFYGKVKAAPMGIEIKNLMEDSGLHVEAQLNTDSSATLNMSSERGAGRVRHVEVCEL